VNGPSAACRYLDRYEQNGLDGLIDRRIEQLSHRRASVVTVDDAQALARSLSAHRAGWSAKHYFAWYRRDGGARSYTWVKRCLQEAHLLPQVPRRWRA